MASARKNLSTYDASTLPDGANMTIGIVVADWNADITHALYEGCYDTLVKHGVETDRIHTVQVPGTFELPAAAKMLAAARRLDGVVCIGCVIKGETSHNEYINMSVAHALQTLSVASGKPFIFGVLTPNDEQQAKDRAGGKYGNKGVEAAATVLRMVGLKQSLTAPKKAIGYGR